MKNVAITPEDSILITSEWDDEIGYLQVSALCSGLEVASARCWKNGHDLEIADLLVRNDLPIPRLNGWLKPRLKSFRNQGIGSKVLSAVIQEARNSNLSRIYGRVVESDRTENPNLLDWYRKFEFEINPSTDIPESAFPQAYQDAEVVILKL